MKSRPQLKLARIPEAKHVENKQFQVDKNMIQQFVVVMVYTEFHM
jgi:hypothetical protein